MASQIPIWEYRQEVYQGPEILNKWGSEGWEVVCTVGKDGSFLILKRPVVKRRRGAAAADTSSVDSSSAEIEPMAARKKFKELI